MFNDIYDEKFDNLDSELVAIKHMISNSRSKVIYVRGSFQNFTYFDRISHQKIGLKNPSIHYRQILSIMDKVQPLLIHIRLGDYLGTNLGILSQQYYYEAFIELEKKFVHNEIWVVSNQIDLAKTMTNSFSDKRFSFEINYFIKNPCELLLLMSNSKSLIISNSTFSLWAAKFAKPDCKVAYPKEFFKGRNFLSNNFNKSWIPINSHWQF
jgi:hypothetical protein